MDTEELVKHLYKYIIAKVSQNKNVNLMANMTKFKRKRVKSIVLCIKNDCTHTAQFRGIIYLLTQRIPNSIDVFKSFIDFQLKCIEIEDVF